MNGGLIKVKTSQRKRKQAKIRAGPAFTPAVLESFQTLGIAPPDSVVGVSTNMATVLSEQLDILQVFFTFLQECKINTSSVLP